LPAHKGHMRLYKFNINILLLIFTALILLPRVSSGEELTWDSYTMKIMRPKTAEKLQGYLDLLQYLADNKKVTVKYPEVVLGIEALQLYEEELLSGEKAEMLKKVKDQLVSVAGKEKEVVLLPGSTHPSVMPPSDMIRIYAFDLLTKFKATDRLQELKDIYDRTDRKPLKSLMKRDIDILEKTFQPTRLE